LDKLSGRFFAPHKRVAQFILIYLTGLAALICYKHARGLSDYVIPGVPALIATGREMFLLYIVETLDTLSIAVLGHGLSIVIASLVAILGRLHNWMGATIKTTAYNVQAFPIVAIAPIIFILVGDGMLSRLIIGALICYFPLLLAFLGILTEPVPEVEHFFVITGRYNWRLEIKVRAFENINKIVTVVVGTATLAMVGTIVAEFIAADKGVGYMIRLALYQSDMANILVSLFVIGLCSSLYFSLLEGLTSWFASRIMGGTFSPLKNIRRHHDDHHRTTTKM